MSRLRLVSDNEQDRAMAEKWWRESSKEDKLAVLGKITQHYDDVAMELMSRFAQLAFSDMLEKFGE